jgi:hypothetical protein
LKSMEKVGGFDTFVLQQGECGMSRRALTVRNAIRRKVSGKGGKRETKN